MIALSGACGSEAHAGGNLPEFTDGRYRRRNLPFNGTTADDEVAPIPAVRGTALEPTGPSRNRRSLLVREIVVLVTASGPS